MPLALQRCTMSIWGDLCRSGMVSQLTTPMAICRSKVNRCRFAMRKDVDTRMAFPLGYRGTAERLRPLGIVLPANVCHLRVALPVALRPSPRRALRVTQPSSEKQYLKSDLPSVLVFWAVVSYIEASIFSMCMWVGCIAVCDYERGRASEFSLSMRIFSTWATRPTDRPTILPYYRWTNGFRPLKATFNKSFALA